MADTCRWIRQLLHHEASPSSRRPPRPAGRPRTEGKRGRGEAGTPRQACADLRLDGFQLNQTVVEQILGSKILQPL